MHIHDLLRVAEAQQRVFVHLQKQILHLASVTQQQDNEEFNKEFDSVLTELETIKKILNPGTKEG